MVTLGNGAQASITGTIAALGRNLIVVQPGARSGRAGRRRLRRCSSSRTLHAIQREIAGSARGRADRHARRSSRSPATATGPPRPSAPKGTYLDARDWPLAMGRTFTEAEERSGRAGLRHRPDRAQRAVRAAGPARRADPRQPDPCR